MSHHPPHNRRGLVAAAVATLAASVLVVLTGGGGGATVTAAGDGFTGLTPARLLDTRPGGETIDGQHTGTGPLGPDTTLTLPIAGRGNVPASGAAAVALNVTAVNPTNDSFITVSPTGTTRPTASNLNLAPGRTLPNMVIVPLGTNGQIDLYNALGTTHLLVDILGWFPLASSTPTTTLPPTSVPPTTAPPTPETMLVSHAIDRHEHGGGSFTPRISRDGSVTTFVSTATNLVAKDTNNLADVFAVDMASGAMERISVADDESQLGSASSQPSVSSDGRFVVFLTAAAIDPADTDGAVDAYRRDRTTGTTVLVSLRDDETQFTGAVTSADVSGNGNVVAFSVSTPSEVHVRNVAGGATEAAALGFVNYSAGGFGPVGISADGDKVVFRKDAPSSVDNGVFRYDVSGNTMDAMIATASTLNAVSRANPVISDDGLAVAWQTGLTGGAIEMVTSPGGAVTRLDVDDAGAPGQTNASGPRFVAGTDDVLFTTASALDPDDTNGFNDVYRRTTGASPETVLISARPFKVLQQTVGDLPSSEPSGSATGVVVFAGGSKNLAADVSADVGARVFARTGTAQPVIVSRPVAAVTAHGRSNRASIASGGRYVVFTSAASDVVIGDFNGVTDAFRRDLQTGETRLVSTRTGGTVSIAGSTSEVDLSSDGNRVVFLAPDVIATANRGDIGSPLSNQVYVRDMTTGTVDAVSHPAGNPGVGDLAFGPRIAANGGHVVFSSLSSTLVSGDTNGRADVFVRDLATGAVERVNLTSANGQSVSANSTELPRADISADGRFVVWSSIATNVVPGASTVADRVYLRDRTLGTTVLVAEGSAPTISDDGRFVAFHTAAPLVPGDTDTRSDVYVVELGTGARTRAPFTAAPGLSATAGNADALVSADGRFVAYTSPTAVGQFDAMRFDRVTGTIVDVGVTTGGVPHDGVEALPLGISADGHRVVFISDATNLAPGDDNADVDVFVRTAP